MAKDVFFGEEKDELAPMEIVEMQRMTDLMIARGLLALLVREMARQTHATPQQIDEWREYACSQLSAGGMTGRPIPKHMSDHAIRTAGEAISEVLTQALLNKGP